MIHVDPNHTNSNQAIPSDLTNIGSIHDSADIRAIENTLSSPVNLVYTPSPVPASPIFTYGTVCDPRSSLYGSSVEIMTPKGNPTPYKNPPNPVPNVPSDPDSDTSFSDSSSLDTYDSSDNNYYKQKRHAKKNKMKRQSRTQFHDPIKECANIAAKLLAAAYKIKGRKFQIG